MGFEVALCIAVCMFQVQSILKYKNCWLCVLFQRTRIVVMLVAVIAAEGRKEAHPLKVGPEG